MSFKLRYSLTTAATILAVTLLGGGAFADSKMKVLHSFGGTPGDGAGLYGGLALDPKGNLYGGTSGGGLGGAGIIYQLAPQRDGTWKESILRSFGVNDPAGDSVNSTFVSDASGNVYGTLEEGGGPATYGTVFKLTPSEKGWAFSVVHRFVRSGNAGSPKGPLIMDAEGNLYGTADYPFELSPAGPWPWTFTLLQNSGPGSNGGLAMDVNHNLYGTTPSGGTGKGCSMGCGTAYELHRDSNGNWDTYVLQDFYTGDDKLTTPSGVLAVDNKGNLYGIALGGAYKDTVLYELSPTSAGSWKMTVLHSFGVGTEGVGGIGGVVFDKAGNMYGMTTAGGDRVCSCGVIYRMTRQAHGAWKYTVLHRFTGNDGDQPEDRLTIDGKGNLYGTTIGGGAFYAGVAFEFTP